VQSRTTSIDISAATRLSATPVVRQDLHREQNISVSLRTVERGTAERAARRKVARGELTLPDTTKFLCEEAEIVRKDDQRIGLIPLQMQPTHGQSSMSLRVPFRMSRDTSLSKPLALGRRNSASVRRRHQ
jgi:hypothetical protein